MKKTILLVLALFIYIFSFSQKKAINREIAKLNYDGYQLMLKEDYKEALKLFNQAIAGDPEAFFIYQNRALCKMYLGDTIESISDLKTNLKFEPKNTECLYNLGNIYKKQKDTTNAIQFFNESIRNASNDFNQKKLIYMYQFLGNTYFERNYFDSASVYFSYLKTADPLNSNSFINSAICNYNTNDIEGFCIDIERAFVLGGAVTCQFLQKFCSGCDKPELASKLSAPNSIVLDKRLEFLLDTDTLQSKNPFLSSIPLKDESKKVKVYFNGKWQICRPEKAVFYREAYWTHYNFFGGSFKDYYASGEIFSEGNINSSAYDGPFTTYFKNGQIHSNGQFRNGMPLGKWTFFDEKGLTQYEIDFLMDDFILHILDLENPDFQVLSGYEKFKILLDTINGLDYSLSGAFQDNKKLGDWKYMIGNNVAIFEEYKDGKFKKGYANTTNGKSKVLNSNINSSLLIPPYLLIMSTMHFESMEAVNFYPFIITNDF